MDDKVDISLYHYIVISGIFVIPRYRYTTISLYRVLLIYQYIVIPGLWLYRYTANIVIPLYRVLWLYRDILDIPSSNMVVLYYGPFNGRGCPVATIVQIARFWSNGTLDQAETVTASASGGSAEVSTAAFTRTPCGSPSRRVATFGG